MKVALYARFSSEKQDADLSIGAQLKALKDYAVKHEYEYSDAHVYIDEAKSALSDNRPEFKRMVAIAKKKPLPFEAILVWKLSRFARNRKDSIIYKSLLKSLGIEVISINEPFDDSPAGQLLEGIIEVIDEFYSANLGQDTVRGMTENAKRGFYNGGTPPTRYLRKKVKDGSTERTKLDIDPVFAPIIKRIYDLACSGMSFKTITQRLNSEGILTRNGKQWGKTTISNILTNEIYTGTFVWNRSGSKPNAEPVCFKNAHPAIIDSKIFNLVQKLIAAKRESSASPRSLSSPYLLSGLLSCGLCGGSLTGYSSRPREKTYYYYACCRALRQGRDQCSLKNIARHRLDGWVLDAVSNQLLNDDLLKKFVDKTNKKIVNSHRSIDSKIQSLKNQSRTVKHRLDRLYDALESGTMEAQDIAPRVKELRQSLKRLGEKRQELEARQINLECDVVDVEMVRNYIENLQKHLGNLKIQKRKLILRRFIEKITVHVEKIDIDFKIPFKREVLINMAEFMTLEQSGSLYLLENRTF